MMLTFFTYLDVMLVIIQKNSPSTSSLLDIRQEVESFVRPYDFLATNNFCLKVNLQKTECLD